MHRISYSMATLLVLVEVSASFAFAADPVMPAPATFSWYPNQVATSGATRLIWQWTGPTLPLKVAASDGAQETPCPPIVIATVNGLTTFPARFSVGWIPKNTKASPGVYACKLAFTMPNNAPAVSSLVASVTVTASDTK
jgi:hypothetical protein